MSATTILVVEDEAIIALDLKRQAENLGYHVCAMVATGEAAVRSATELKPDLVVMDIHLAGAMDGVEAASQIRARLDIPVVFLSAYSEDETLRRARNSHPYGYLVKPFDSRELHAAIQVALDRSQSERALRLSEARLQAEKSKLEAILASIGEGLVVSDMDGHLLFVNREAERVFGALAQGETCQSYTERVQIFRPDGKTPFPHDELPLARVLRGESAEHVELIVRHTPDKHGITLRATGGPIRDARGNLLGGVVVFSDISREKELDRLKTEFVAVASHELRTPMSAIKGIADMILGGDYGPVNENLREPLIDILTSTDRLISLVNELLDVHRLETGTMTFALQDLDLRELVAESVLQYQPLAPVQRVQLRLRPEGPVHARVQVDRNRLRQVLGNLIGNALKFTEQGSVSLEISEPDAESLQVRVEDTGPGISESDQGLLFRKFQQIQTQVSGKPPGSGLGLYLSRHLLRHMGGDLKLERSAPGAGSVFAFSLPKSDSESAARARRALLLQAALT